MSKSILHLPIKEPWFGMTASGEKTEEYREITPYWVSRLTTAHKGAIGGDLMSKHKCVAYRFKEFAATRLVNGYGLHRPAVDIECLGISIGQGRPEWGAPPDRDVFIIRHGKIIARRQNGSKMEHNDG